ncbi:FAD-dependent oxidoreductase [Flavobacterium selenitireducens]|uniref:FAD-dependent oxidoreductase n=1 Tax=Flavobacterium selenitireducens TaxID=2722704 RepID=UPI00168B05C8|nr:FAD-dependent oxidoreductase [Flavobacterium selenitireducens]MBD3582285.1 NAD(P)/FAD-dependent oxidoreductase [Flavobacterium selenitireducens]
MYDVLIVGGGVAGVSCALILGSAKNKLFMAGKKIGILTHQKTSNLQEAIFNNAYGIAPGTLGVDLLDSTLRNLRETYPHIDQIASEKVMKIEGEFPEFTVTTNKNTYQAKKLVMAVGYSNTFMIEGLMEYVEPHQKSLVEKKRIQLRNIDHKIADGLYVAGTLAGWRSQLSIAAGSGASVATDILTAFNGGIDAQSHDKRQL